MSSQVVKVKRDEVAACMKCPICNKLFREATTISLCLHTFCRKCIHEKLSEENVDCCPVCGIHLGCMPEEKLRPDHSWQHIRANLFPHKGSKVEAPEATSSVASPAKRKEKSLTTLAVSPPSVSEQIDVSDRGSVSATEETPNKQDDSVQDCLDGSQLPDTLNEVVQNKEQNFPAKSSDNQIAGEPMEINSKELKAEASGSKDIDMGKMRIEDNQQKPEVQDEQNSMPSALATIKCKRGRPKKKRSPAPAGTSCPVVVVNETRQNCEDRWIWFSLVPSEDLVGCETLPQVSAPYLRVKDPNMSVSTIQKYLAQKLDLTNEAEIQIMCLGEILEPHLKLSSVLEAWLHASSPHKNVQTSVGNSTEESVMVLSYARRVAAPTA